MKTGIKQAVCGAMILLVTVIVLWGSLSLFQTHTMLTEVAEKGIEAELHFIADELNDSVARELLFWKAILKDERVQQSLAQSNSEFALLEDREANLQENDTKWIQGDKEIIERILNNKASKRLRNIIENDTPGINQSFVSEVFYTNRYGANVAATNVTTDYRQDDEDWWKNAKESPDYFDSRVSFDASANVYSLLLAIRLENEAHEFSGIAKVVIDLSFTKEIIDRRAANLRKLASSDLTLISGKGDIIYSTDSEMKNSVVGSNYFAKRGTLSDQQNIEFEAYETAGTLIYELPLWRSSTKSRSEKLSNWSLVAVVSTKELFREINEYYKKRVIWFAAVLLFITLLCWRTLRFIGVSFRKLHSTTTAIAAGDLSSRTGMHGDNELGQLGETFDRMADHIEQLIQTNQLASTVLAKENVRRESILLAARLVEWEYDTTTAQLLLPANWWNNLQIKLDDEIEDPTAVFLQSSFESDRVTFFSKLVNSATTSEVFEMPIRIVDVFDVTHQLVARGSQSAQLPGTIYGILYDNTEQHKIEMRYTQGLRMDSIGKLAAGIAHEINTPLQYVESNMELINAYSRKFIDAWRTLKETTATHEVDAETLSHVDGTYKISQYIRKIPDALGDITDGIDAMSKITQALRIYVHPTNEVKVKTDLNLLIEQTCTLCQNEWNQVATLEFNLDPAIPHVEAFPAELSQVFLNLLTNATHALQEKFSATRSKGCIKVTTRWDREAQSVEVEIADTAFGISANNIEKIFEPFFTTKKVGRGSGQGLAICHSIVTKRHNGTIRVHSIPGTGTSFFVTLPVSEIEQHDHP